ncbi:unnamed protein product [Spodoptera littoralis]|uniref:DNA-directed DNA polymerase n=1 Tax=Spodoptera littoralis TaxID=7109 RepID=A0A9P0N2V9_SPOLI|nr:unnamed protein product [Spodoptera littoralis]
MRTNIHKANCLLNTKFANIHIIATAFNNRIMTYRLNVTQEDEYLGLEAFLSDHQTNIVELITMSLNKHNCIKVNFELFAYFMLPTLEEKQLKSFNTKYNIIYKNTDLNELLTKVMNALNEKLTEFQHCQSGWTFVSMSHLEININKYSPMRGGSYIDLPPAIKHSRSCINIKNEDDCCFLWSIVAGLYPAKNNVCRTSSYPHYSSVLNIEGMSFPPTMNDIKQFEKNNPNMSVNIYGLQNNIVTGPLYASKHKREHHFNLLYIENNTVGHYCLIKDLIRLVRRQVTHYKGKVYLCDACLQFFSSETRYKSHNCSKILSILPEKKSILKFKHFERQQKINFIIYADFECMLIDCNESNSLNTRKLKTHQPSCFAYYICCAHNNELNKYVSYRGTDCAEVFVKYLIRDAKRIHRILSNKKSMTPLTTEQEMNYQNSNTCHICKQLLLNDKVRDHDHITSEYRGAAHSHCNLMYRVCSFIPVVFHNLSGYDSHLFIQELAKYEGTINIIPKTKEKYLSITKVIKTEKYNHPIQIKFIDSFQFLSSSLDALSDSLSENDFLNLSREFSDKRKFDLMRKKGVYPYDYIDSWSKFDETQLPSKYHFYNSLCKKHITDEEYLHAQTVWNVFNVKSLGEYTDLYIKCDVLLLCDIFEKFRETSLHYYKLDPAYYVTSPSLSWDAMLLYTDTELELISDLQMYELLEKGIRGGLAQCSRRHAEANNKYLPHFNESEPSSYLIYLDCNNLYGYAMMKKLPISEFKFLTLEEISNFDVITISDDNDYGYILEVDLIYPNYLHNKHKDLPFAVEKLVPPYGKSAKLIANLYDKHHYVIHYVHLKECLKNGLILKKIHCILSFRQECFLKNYIDLNTRLRQNSKTVFEKDFFKLLNNAIFGKTIENKRKQADVKLVTKWRDTTNKTNKHLDAEKLLAKPNLKSVSIFSDNFIAVELYHEKVVLDRPIYIGFTVLEYSKQHLYQFHYDFIKKKYGNNAKLCYTDTDSLLYLIYTTDFYQDMHDDLTKFDTSNFAVNNPYHIPQTNAKVPGLWKHEMGDDLIIEFVGLRAKLYFINSLKTQIKKAKGVSKSITNNLKLDDYSNVLLTDKALRCKMNMIKSIKHVLYSQQVDKQVLDRNDDKIQVLQDQIHTLPWGHCDSMFLDYSSDT